MSSLNKQKRKEDGELSNDEEEHQDSTLSKQPKTSGGSSKDESRRSKRGGSRSRSQNRRGDKRSEERNGKSTRRENRDEKESKSHRRHSSRSSSYQRSNTTQSKSTRGKSREKKRGDSRDRRRDSRDRGGRSNSHKRSKARRDSRSPDGRSKRRDSRSPRSSRGGRDNERRKDDSRRTNKSRSPQSKRDRSEDNGQQTGKSPKSRMTEQEMKELEEANDRKHDDLNGSDSDSYLNQRNSQKNKSSKFKYSSHLNKSKRSPSNDDTKRSSKTAQQRSSRMEEERNDKNGASHSKKGGNDGGANTKQKASQNYDADTLLLMGELEQEIDSEEEREKKKQELLDIIKGIKGKNTSQNEVKPAVDEIEVEEEQGFDNDLINPDDAFDDEEGGTAAVADDYQGENDAAIKDVLNSRSTNKKGQMNYLRNLEEMRNRETKEGLEEETTEYAANNAGDAAATAAASGGQQSQGRASYDWKETNKMHAFEEKDDSESEADMFGDDIEKFIGGDKAAEGQTGVKVVNAECDDDQQYFKIRVGEVLAGKYKILEKCGKGVFANVCKAEQLDNGKLVAIKILRSNEIMHESGQREKELVQKLNLSDKNDKKHIVRLKNVFEHHKHICLVFECFAMNLREALKQYAKGKGFSLDIVRSYAFQIFIALTHLKKNRMIHADLKPDNLLISEDTKTLKMCDFGTALSVEENGIIKYIQSRYYRAPEVLLGYPPYNSIDVWSIGVTLYEIYTQKYLFDGSSNNEMIKLIMDARGKFNKKMLQIGSFVNEYFDQNYTFQYIQVDPTTKQKHVKAIQYGDIPKNDLNKLLFANKEGVQFENQKKLAQFKDFLDKCLQLDPKNRITPEDALRHPFLDTSVKVK